MESVVSFSSILLFGFILLTVALFVAIYSDRSGKSHETYRRSNNNLVVQLPSYMQPLNRQTVITHFTF